MKKLLILHFCLISTASIGWSQKTMASVEKPLPIEIRGKGVATNETNKIEDGNVVFPAQTFNRILESQLKYDGLLGQSEKLIKLQLTDKILTVNAVEVETKFKDKYLNLYLSFMRKPACQGCFVSYIID